MKELIKLYHWLYKKNTRNNGGLRMFLAEICLFTGGGGGGGGGMILLHFLRFSLIFII